MPKMPPEGPSCKIFEVTRHGGALVIEYGLKIVRLYERDEILNLILPLMPKEGEKITFEIKVENA